MREEKADNAADEPESSNVPERDQLPADGATESKRRRNRTSGLAAPNVRRLRSRSRHSAVADQGQIGPSADDLSKLAPPVPGLAEATAIAPERQASALPSPTSATSSSAPPPDIIVSDDPQSPYTLIPATDTLSTRPTKGGVAYPFSLKVGGATGKHVNASTLTLQSVNIATPPAVDVPQHEGELGVASSTVNGQVLMDNPGLERSFAPTPGAGLVSKDAVEEDSVRSSENVQRPPVERFETAKEDLSMLSTSNEKM